MINGKPASACKTLVENGMVLEPLPYFPIVRDLVVDRHKARDKYAKLRPWLARKEDISKTVMPVSAAEVMVMLVSSVNV